MQMLLKYQSNENNLQKPQNASSFCLFLAWSINLGNLMLSEILTKKSGKTRPIYSKRVKRIGMESDDEK